VRCLKQGVTRRVQHHGLTPRQFGVLVALFETGPSTLHELALRIGIDDPTASRVVKALARRRLVRGRRDADDRRLVRLEATPAARRMRDPLLAVARELRTAVVCGFSPSELRALLTGLARVHENARGYANAVGASNEEGRAGGSA